MQELGPGEHLVLGHAAAIVAEEDRARQTDRRDWHGTVDPGGDAQAQRPALLGSVRLRIDPALLEYAAQRDGVVETDGDPAEPAAQHLGRGEERASVLLLLLAAEQFLLIAPRLGDLLVGDGDGREHHVLANAAQPSLHFQGEHSELGREQLPRARPAALDEELLREAVGEEPLHVRGHDRAVHAVALEAAPDEERSAHAQKPPDRPEVQVVAGRDVGRLQAVVVADDGHHHVVEVALVRRAEDERRPLPRLREPLHPGLVDVHAVVDAGEDPAHHRLEQIDGEGRVAGRDLAQVLARRPIELLFRDLLFAGDLLQCVTQLQIVERLLRDALRALQRRTGDDARLTGEVMVERAANPPRHAVVGRRRILRGDRGQIDGSAHLHHRLPAMEEEGGDAADGARLLRIAEEEVADRAAQLLRAPPPQQRDGGEENRATWIRPL